MMHDGGWAFAGGWMWIFWLIALVAVIALLVWFVRAASGRSAGNSGPPGASQSPEAILKERYARGEIDEAEYQRRKEQLGR